MSEKQIRELREETQDEVHYQYKEFLKANAIEEFSETAKKHYRLYTNECIRIQLIEQILNYKEE